MNSDFMLLFIFLTGTFRALKRIRMQKQAEVD